MNEQEYMDYQQAEEKSIVSGHIAIAMEDWTEQMELDAVLVEE